MRKIFFGILILVGIIVIFAFTSGDLTGRFLGSQVITSPSSVCQIRITEDDTPTVTFPFASSGTLTTRRGAIVLSPVDRDTYKFYYDTSGLALGVA